MALVALCLLGLVVAAFVAPATSDGAGGGPGGGVGDGVQNAGDVAVGSGGGSGDSVDSGAGDENTGGETDVSDDGSDEDGRDDGGDESETAGEEGDGNGGESDESDESGDREGDDEGDGVPVLDAPEPDELGCIVVLEDRAVPGATVRVRVWNDLEPVPDVPVWFGDRSVGRTDEDGRVSGRAPYTREMDVTVRVPDADCRFVRLRSDDGETRPGESVEPDPLVSSLDADIGRFSVDRGELSSERSAQNGADDNETASYEVRGSVEVAVDGEPRPGETVTVTAAVDGVEMRRATVSVDDERVGRTTSGGQYELTIPSDIDRERLTITVERGEFAGATTIEVWRLQTEVVPQEGLPFPGEPAVVTASVGDQRVSNASVSLDGVRLGSTDERGRVGMALPADPRGTVTVQTDGRTATVPLWTAYAQTIAVGALLLVVGVVAVAAATRARGRGAGRRVATWWIALAAVFCGLVVGERVGAAEVGAVVLVAGAVRNRDAVGEEGASLAERLRALTASLGRTPLRVADLCVTVLDWLAVPARWLVARVAAVPGRMRGFLGRSWDRLRERVSRTVSAIVEGLSLRRGAAIVAVFAAVGWVTDRYGALGFVVSLVVLAGGGYVWMQWIAVASESSESSGSASGRTVSRNRSEPAEERSNSEDEGPKERTIRAVWRRFARWVRPNSWRQSTPAEVSETAIERGYPERPVRVLTEAFREVEYGGRASTERADEARDAFDTIEREWGGKP